jgi:rhodanese-related sulfurtransferase
MDLIAKIFGKPVMGISPTEAQAKLSQNGRPFILDVRQPEEFRDGHIRGAKLIPLNELAGRMNELPKNQEIICVCRSGNRSSSATRQLSGAGYQVSNLTGGMIAWTHAGLPVKQDKE